MVLKHGFGIDQQAAYQGTFTVVYRAAGDEFEGVGH
jgi:hypothetical protein